MEMVRCLMNSQSNVVANAKRVSKEVRRGRGFQFIEI